MLKMPITYTDFNDEEHTEDFYFNISKAELATLHLEHGGGFEEYINRIIAAKDGAEIMATFKKILELSYGRRSDDGRLFVKTPEAWLEFYSSGAYDAFFLKLVTDATAGADFVNGIMPKDAKKVAIAADEAKSSERTIESYTTQELLEMPDHAFNALVQRQPHNVPRHLLVAAMQRRNREEGTS